MYRRVLVFGRLACYVTGMGHVYQRVKLAAVNEEDLNILIDTGATLSLIPPALADRLGIARFPRKQVIVLADGRRIEADAGVVMVEIGDRKAVSTVVIADCDEPLLGVETLETLGLAVDPTTGSLTPTRSFTVRLGAVIIWPGEKTSSRMTVRSSSSSKSDGWRNGPRCSATTRKPAAVSCSIMTPPPAPVPITQTSNSSGLVAI